MGFTRRAAGHGADFQIRRALESDAQGVERLASELTTTFPFEGAAFTPCYSRVLETPTAVLLVAEHEGEIIGYLLGYRHPTFWAGADVWWVEELLVHMAHRRSGVGRTLMTSFEENAKLAGARLVCLVTRRASGFYTAIGYEQFALHFRKMLWR